MSLIPCERIGSDVCVSMHARVFGDKDSLRRMGESGTGRQNGRMRKGGEQRRQRVQAGMGKWET